MKTRPVISAWAAALVLAAAAYAQESGLSQQQLLEKAQGYYLAGKAYIDQGNYSAANEEFAKAEMILRGASFAPLDQAPAVGSAGAAQPPAPVEETQSPAGMIAAYLQELRSESSDPDFYYNLAVEYLKKGQYVQAEEAFLLVLNSRPDDPDACYNLGILYENYLSDRKKALYYYREYIRLSPKARDSGQVESWIEQLESETKADKDE